MLGLTNDQLMKYVGKLIAKTKYSNEQINLFFNVLSDRMDTLHISSISDLLIRYNCISKANYSGRVELLKGVVGIYHMDNLMVLMDILESEKNSKEMIEFYNAEIEVEKEIQNKVDMSSKEYQESINKEIEYLERKKRHIANL